MDAFNENDELKRDAPFLAGLPKTDPFAVPDAFFERFPHEVQAHIVSGAARPSVGFSWKRIAIALPVVALIAAASWWLLPHGPQGPEVAQVQVTPLSDAELAAYEDIDAFAISSPDELPELGQVNIDLNDDDLVAYLNEEHLDLTELITETE